MIRSRLLRGSGANALGQMVSIGVQLLLVPVLASRWGLERYGLWLLVATIPSYLIVSDLGFARAAAVDMTWHAARDDREGAVRVFQSMLALVVGLCGILIVAAVLLLLLLLPDPLFAVSRQVAAHELRMTILFMALYGILALAGTAFDGGFQSSGTYPQQMALVALAWLVEGAAAMATAMAGGGLEAVALAYLVSRVGVLASLAGLLRWSAPWVRFGFGQANRHDLGRLIRPAAAMMTLPLANACILQGTALALGWAASSAAVPAFTTARTLARLGIQVTGIVTRASLPEFTMAHSRGQTDVQNKILLLILAATALVLLPGAVMLTAAGPLVIVVWTHGVIHASFWLVAAMALMMVANGYWNGVSTVLIAVNRQQSFAGIFLALAVASIPLGYLLSLRLGSTGGAVSMLVVDMVMTVVITRLVARSFAARPQLVEAARLFWRERHRPWRKRRS